MWSASTAARGRAPMLPLLGAIRDAVSTHVAALPVPYLHLHALRHRRVHQDGAGVRGGPSRRLLRSRPHHIRAMAQALGRTPPASRYSPDMSKHAYFGTDDALKTEYLEYGAQL